MKIRNKKYICFFLVMFVTLLSCCIVTAHDNADYNTSTALNNEKNVQTIENNNLYETSKNIKTNEKWVQSEDNTIEETDDNNEVKQEENINAKAIKKSKYYKYIRKKCYLSW